MPTYPYFCKSCSYTFDVIKSISRFDDNEFCEKCEGVATRQIGRVNFNGASDWNQPSTYNHAFGCVVKSKQHQREILSRYKDHGRELIEVGTEPPEKIHKYFENQRAEASEKRWSESAEKIIKDELL
jgi:putative FmdB family regulatory protein